MPSKYKSSATTIPLDQAVGKVLAHDITEIRPGQFKGAAFRKGYVVKEEDLPHLRRLGKEHLFVLHIGPGEVHEDDAALRLAEALSGPGVTYQGPPSEGKIALRASHRGLLKVNVEALVDLGLIPEISCASRHNNTVVGGGEIIAAARAVPLIIEEETLDRAVEIAGSVSGIFSVKPFLNPPTGIIITGNEVFQGLIEDKFAPILRKKLQAFDCEVRKILFAPDDKTKIVKGIKDTLQAGAKLVMVSGGMSVDPDDMSRLAIAEAGAEDILYGTPVQPGSMFLYSRIGSVPILGLPACILFHKATILDLVLPRVLAGEHFTRQDFAAMAHGGLCFGCIECRYPVCPFGK
jgi:molybdopterin biosynthesis enzyme